MGENSVRTAMKEKEIGEHILMGGGDGVGENFSASKKGEGSRWQCNACWEVFRNIDEQKAHYKSDWHRYNLRRKAGGFPPVPEILFERKLQQLFHPQVVKGDAHLKKKKDNKKAGSNENPNNYKDDYLNKENNLGKAENEQNVKNRTNNNNAKKTPSNNNNSPPLSYSIRPYVVTKYNPTYSLFDNRCFNTLEENIAYMKKAFSFFIYDEDYVINKEGLIKHLGNKIYKHNRCLYCGRYFSSLTATQHHMTAKGHTFMAASMDEDAFAAIEKFYDYTQSYTQLIEEIAEKKKMVDIPQILNAEENKSDEDMLGDSHEEDLYSEGVSEAEEDGNSSEWEDLEEEEEEKKSASLHKIEKKKHEKTKMHKFFKTQKNTASILASLGIRKAELTDTGDLRLPDGRQVVHRSMAYVYKQRLPARGVSSSFRSNFALADSPMAAHRARYNILHKRNARDVTFLPSSIHSLFRRSRELHLYGEQRQQLRLGIRNNTLQRTIHRKTKYFL